MNYLLVPVFFIGFLLGIGTAFLLEYNIPWKFRSMMKTMKENDVPIIKFEVTRILGIIPEFSIQMGPREEDDSQ